MKSFLESLRMLLSMRCAESTRLISDSSERELSWVERWSIRLHALGCVACRRFRKQIALLHAALRTRGGEPESLSAEARQKIEQALRDARS